MYEGGRLEVEVVEGVEVEGAAVEVEGGGVEAGDRAERVSDLASDLISPDPQI